MCVAAARHRQEDEEAQQDTKYKTSPSAVLYIYLGPECRDTRRTLTRVSKVNVRVMSSLLGVW